LSAALISFGQFGSPKPSAFRQILFPDIHTARGAATIFAGGQLEKTGFGVSDAT
jgi:hypothetical protein